LPLLAKQDKGFQGLIPYLSKIQRRKGFEQDLRYFLGQHWEAEIGSHQSDGSYVNAAVSDYLKHISSIEDSKPHLLLPYWYHLNLALLAGGQSIKRLTKRALHLEGLQGQAVFHYEDFLDSRGKGLTSFAFRTALKADVDCIVFNPEELREILFESAEVFRRNNALVSAMDVGGRRVLCWLMVLFVAIFAVCILM